MDIFIGYFITNVKLRYKNGMNELIFYFYLILYRHAILLPICVKYRME